MSLGKIVINKFCIDHVIPIRFVQSGERAYFSDSIYFVYVFLWFCSKGFPFSLGAWDKATSFDHTLPGPAM